MQRPRGVGAAAVLLVGVMLAPVSLVLGEGEDGSGAPVSSGVFTAEQAEAGREAFAEHCARCHGAELEGGFGPTLVPLDRDQFGDRPLSHPFGIITTEMPFDAPGSLEADVYAEILAFILSENGYPSGPEPLPADRERLTEFVLDDPPAE